MPLSSASLVGPKLSLIFAAESSKVKDETSLTRLVFVDSITSIKARAPAIGVEIVYLMSPQVDMVCVNYMKAISAAGCEIGLILYTISERGVTEIMFFKQGLGWR